MSDTVAAPAPTAPMISTGAESVTSVDDAIANVAKMAVAESIKEPAPETPRAPDGKFAKKDDAPAVPVPETQPTTDAPVTDPAPETEVSADAKPAEDEAKPDDAAVAVPPVQGRELATKFRLLSQAGEEFDVPDVVLEFRANGKTRSEPLDKVVKMAEWGYHNQERDQEAQRTAARIREVEAENQRVVEYARTLETQRNKLLQDPDEYMRELAAFEASNTPEAKLQAMEEQRRQDEARQQFREVSDTGSKFFGSEIEPAVETIMKALPTVAGEEIGAKLLLITDRYKVNTPFGMIVPPSAYDAVRKAVVGELVPWAQQVHDSRDSERKESTKKLEDTTRTAQADAQKAKSLTGRVLKPTGRAGKDVPREQPIRTVDDAHNSALRATLAAVGTSG